MAEENEQLNGANGASAEQEQQAASFSIQAQYIKDFSFENPNAPQSLLPKEQAPGISININVDANKLDEKIYAVELTLEAQAGEEKNLMFRCELIYGGVFTIDGIPDEHLAPFIMIEAPRMLFPFARQIIASTTQASGFPPLMIDPIDFAALYRQKMMADKEANS